MPPPPRDYLDVAVDVCLHRSEGCGAQHVCMRGQLEERVRGLDRGKERGRKRRRKGGSWEEGLGKGRG